MRKLVKVKKAEGPQLARLLWTHHAYISIT